MLWLVHPVVIVMLVVSTGPVEVCVGERVPTVQLALTVEDPSAVAGQSGHIEPAEGAGQSQRLLLSKRR